MENVIELKALKYFTSVKLGGDIRAGYEFKLDGKKDRKLIKDLIDAELVAIKNQTARQESK